MPTHIDVLCGNYQSVVDWNDTAIDADEKFVAREGAVNFYSFYRCHNYHFKAYGGMFLGQFALAMEAADAMVRSLPEELMRVPSPPMADWLEAFVPTDYHVLIRFGKWEEILATAAARGPAPLLLHDGDRALRQGCRRAATRPARRGRQAEPRCSRPRSSACPRRRKLMNNFCHDILAIAREMMQGEIAYRTRPLR